jgi:carboxyl-terminal processing protease
MDGRKLESTEALEGGIMRSYPRRWQVFAFLGLIGCVFGTGHAPAQAVASATADDSIGRVSRDTHLTRSIDLVRTGDFEAAAEEIKGLESGDGVTAKVRDWLFEFKKLQDERRELNRQDFDKYVGYAKARIEREEFRQALGWVRRAADVAENKDAFLDSAWVRTLVAGALTEAEGCRDEHNWIPAYNTYSNLADLYQREPRYKKLENEVLTHLRLDVMFDKKGRWQERLERIRWEDAEPALAYIERWYFAGPGQRMDFRKVAESALEQLLILADSPSAKEVLADTTRLDDEFDRADFKARITKNIEDIREASSVSQRTAGRHFRRALQINRETIGLPEELVVSELMRGALEPLDDYTTIIWPAEAEEFEKHTRGDFVGVGISIIKNDKEEIEVSSPMANTPAYQAGVLPGDIITHVNGASLKGFTLNKTVNTIVGPPDTDVTLTMRREGKSFDLPLMRKVIKIPSVMGVARRQDDPQAWDHWIDEENHIAYVRADSFQENTVEDLDNVIRELKADGAQALILDLRGNPGGLLTSAQQMVSLFMGRGEPVVSTKGQIPGENQDYVTKFDGPHKDIPLTVLVDERSASASEIVSGAIRDNHRGVVIGERTFGKFSVQNLIPLGTNGKAKLKLTTARYYLPSGDSLHRDAGAATWGVKPDVTVPLCTKEKIRILEMRREAERIGPAPKALVEAEAETGGATVGDTDEPEEPELTWFTLDDASVYDMTVENKKDTEAFDHVEVDGQSVETLAKTGDGGDAAIKTLRVEGDQIGVLAEDAEGKPVEVTKLFVDNLEPSRNKLPRLVQTDENTRPRVDPQLDSALLQMRVMLLARSYPALATAERAEQTETARP